MSAPPAQTADLLAQLRKEDETRTFARFDPLVLTRLALIPEWTDDLAGAVGLWTRTTGRDALDALQQADLVDRRLVLAPGGRRQGAFWVRARTRPSLASYLHTTRPRIERDLDQLVKAIRDLDVNAFGLRAWLDVASVHRRDSTGLSLVTAVDQLVVAGQLAGATDLVGAARVIGEVTGGPLADDSRRAGWRIERAYRADIDKEALRFYVHRADIEKALDEVIDPASPWALHLRGDGGVGKTMLVRYLASGRYAEERGQRPFPVARTDFDYLDPRYPEERPAELLLALAHELVSFADSRGGYRFFRQFQDAANHLHEECGRPDSDPGAIEDLQAEAIRHFAKIVTEASGPAGDPVVLVLDTCEELAKLYPPGAQVPAPAIDRAFAMLTSLHDQAPAVRLLLAGRRRLTPADDAHSRATGPRLLPRPYVRVLRVQGLPAREASRYIDLRIAARQAERPDAPPPDEALREAILYRAREPGDDDRYNPFVLASYCEWAYSDAPPDARELREAPGDPYVQLRIIGRITDDAVRQALPVAVEFGRFDAELIAPALARQGLDPEAAFAGLASQEWVKALTVTPRGSPGVVEVDEHLRERIRAVLLETNAYTTGDPAQLGRDAADLIQNRPLRTVPAEAVEAAVRLLPTAEAAVMWERLEAKTVAESAWSWADTVTARAGAAEVDRARRSGPGSPTILGAVLATQAAVRIHSGVSDELADLWQRVAEAADRFPDPDGTLRLKARAVLGRVAVGADVDEKTLESVGRGADAGSLIAAIDGPVGRGQRPPAAVLRMAADIAPADPAADAALLLAQATLALWDGRLDSATHLADQALAAALRAERTDDGAPERDYAAWRGPRRLADRCRLARLLIAWQRDEPLSAELIRTWRQSVVEHRSDPDAQRLAALTIRFELGHHPVAAEVLRGLDAVMRPAKAVTWLHRQVRPLAVEVAEAWSVLGDPAQAASVLRFARDSAVELGDDPETIDMLQLAQLALCRRYRTDEYASSLLQLAHGGTAAVRAEAWLVLTLLTGERPSNPSEAGSWHGWWRSQDVRSLRDTSAPPPPEYEPGIGTLARAADRLEYQAVAGLTPGPRNAPEGLQLADEHGARLWLLAGRPGRPSLPDGAFGRAALAAGEVLALRLPEEAADLLREAERRLTAAGDDIGAGQAHVLADLALARAGHSGQGAEPPDPVRRGIATMADAPQWEGWWGLLAVWGALDDAPRPITGNRLPELDFRTSVAETVAPTPRRRRWRYQWASIAAAPAGVLAILVALLPEDLAVIAGFVGVVAALTALFPLAFANLARGYLVRCQAITIKPTSSGTVILTGRRHGGTREFHSGPDSPLAWLTRLCLGGLRRLTWSAEWALGPPGPTEVSGLRLPETRFPGGLALVSLEVDPRLEPYPWEQWIGQAASPRLRRRLLFVRAVPRDTLSLPPRAWSSAPAVYLGPHTLTPPRPVIPRPGAGEGSGSHPRRVLYLVGSPVPTAASWRMRVSAAVSAETTESSRSVVTGEELVSIDSLGLSGTPLVVLQAEPLGDRPRALGDLGPGFRALAREAVDAGARAVLVVPTLPDLPAADLVSTTWSRIASRRRPPPTHRLYAVAAKAKQLAWDTSPPDGDQAVLDVLLFLRVPELEKES